MRRRLLRSGAVAALGCAVLLPFFQWGAPLEATEGMALNTANMPIKDIAVYYPPAPNNHVLFSMILHGIDRLSPVQLTGKTLADPRFLRLVSIAGSAAAVILLYCLALMIAPPPVAALAAVAFGASFWRLMYSYRLRGYGLAIAVNLLNLWLIQQAIARRRRGLLFALPLTVAAAHYLLPTDLVYTAALGAYAAYLFVGARRAGALREASTVGGALAAGLALTVILYFPIWRQVRAAMTQDWNYRWSDFFYFRVLGAGTAYPVFFGLVSAWGLFFALRRGGRWRSFGVLLSLYLGLSFLCFAANAHPAPTRACTSLLPFWALAFAAGLYGAVATVRPDRLRAAALGLVGFAAVAAGGQVETFVAWNRGLDVRRVFARMAEKVRDVDDFVVIYTPMGRPDMELGFAYWVYYGQAINLWNEVKLFEAADLPYRIRGRYYVLALDADAAQSALRRSAADRFIRSTLRLEERVEKIGIYSASLDDSVLAAYRRALASPGTTSFDRRDALLGLGDDAIRRRDFAAAAVWIEKAKILTPDDAKTRFLLGLARSLAFDDAKAAEEFEWVVANDTQNVDAPFYYAETLAALGRPAQALPWYRWYHDPDRLRGAWFYAEAAAIGEKSAAAGKVGRQEPLNGGVEAWEKASLACYARGAYERAAVAMENAAAIEPTTKRRFLAAQMRRDAGDWAEAERSLSQLVAKGAGGDAPLFLAETLTMKYRNDEARKLCAAILAQHPDDRRAAEFSAKLARLPY
jgi:hypothetical protein